MGPLKRKTKVTPELFIDHESDKAVGDKSEYFSELFSACKAQAFNSKEAAIFSGFMPLLAMGLARLDENIQHGYTRAFSQKVDSAHGDSTSELFHERVLEYLSAFDNDVADGKGDKLPTFLSIVLNNICRGFNFEVQRLTRSWY